MAGGAIDGRRIELDAADGNRFAAFRADALRPSGAGMLVLPDVRGLFPYYEELAVRFAEAGIDALAIDYFGRTAGSAPRPAAFDSSSHVARTTWAGLRTDVAAAAAAMRAERAVTSLFSVGFCFGGRLSFLLSSLRDLALSGVVGFYGWPVGRTRNDMPAPIDLVDRFAAPVLAIFGGADDGIPATAVSAFDAALARAGVSHRTVTYPGAPHSFFDRKQAEFGAASSAAWEAVLDFVGASPS
jgi:carboxymethylenebutenolidase